MKIYIVGSVASGKTTLAKKLSNHLNIHHYELDTIVRVQTGKGRYKRTAEEQVEEIARIDKDNDWIIEGTYRESCHCLFDKADRIIFLDTPYYLRKIRIFTRFLKQQLHIEPSHYKSDLKMLKSMYKWTNQFEENKNQFQEMLGTYGSKVIKIDSIKLENFTDNLN